MEMKSSSTINGNSKRLGDQRKDKDQLIEELESLRSEIVDLKVQTEQYHQIKNSLIASKEYSEGIIRNMTDAVLVVSPGYTILNANDKFHELIGVEKQDVIGHKCHSVFRNLSEPCHKSGYSCHLKSIHETGKQVIGEQVVFSKDGHERAIEVNSFPLFDSAGEVESIVQVSRDITERKQADDVLRDSEKKYRLLVSNIPDVAWTTDNTGKTVFIGPGVESIYGYTPQQIYRDSDNVWLGRIHPKDVEKVENAFGELFEHGTVFDVQYRIKKKDGEWIWLHDKAIEVYERDGVMYADGIFSDITERKQAEEALKESEQRYKSFVENFAGIAFRGKPGFNPVFFHGAVEEITGYKAEEFVSGKVRIDEIVHPDDMAFYQEAANKAQSDPTQSANVEHRIICKDGNVRWIRQSAKVVFAENNEPLCVDGTLNDITERKQAESALQEYSDRLRKLSDASFDGIVIMENGIVLEANQTFADLYGYQMSELVGMPAVDFVAPESKAQVLKHIQIGYSEPYEVKAQQKDGTTFEVEACGTATTYQGSPVRITAMRDITERKQSEEATAQVKVLKEVDQLRKALIASVSHELRTPLASIKGLADTLIQPDVEWDVETQQDYLKTIKQESDRLTHIVSDLIQMSQLEAGMMKMNRSPSVLSALFIHLRHQLVELTPNHVLEIDIPRGLPPIEIDEIRVGEVVTNLVSNAVRYSEEGSQINIKAEAVDGKIMVSVSDEGEGIPEEHLVKVFDRFHRLEPGIARRRGGTGLGLAICKEIIDGHEGTIWVESEVGKGSKFCFTLPVMDRSIVDDVEEIFQEVTG